MTFINTRNKQKLVERRLREVGYADGYARRPARYTLRTYQVSYRLGSVERDAMEEGRDGDAA